MVLACSIIPDYRNAYYYQNVGRAIVRKYREAAVEHLGLDFFSEANNYGAPLPVSSGYRSAELPCFWEVARYVADAGATWRKLRANSRINSQPHVDPHFLPVGKYCDVCAGTGYTHVLRFEDLRREWPHLARAVAAGAGANSTEQQLEMANANPHSGLSDEQLTQLYFRQLSEQDVRDLFEFYEMDFKLFGYEFRFSNVTFP